MRLASLLLVTTLAALPGCTAQLWNDELDGTPIARTMEFKIAPSAISFVHQGRARHTLCGTLQIVVCRGEGSRRRGSGRLGCIDRAQAEMRVDFRGGRLDDGVGDRGGGFRYGCAVAALFRELLRRFGDLGLEILHGGRYVEFGARR